jgi:hypothetical protein
VGEVTGLGPGHCAEDTVRAGREGFKVSYSLQSEHADVSPKINPDLLQRSEVVALFNTLHRTSESLAAVEQFRQMYKDTQDAEAAAAKTRAEEKLKAKVSSRPCSTEYAAETVPSHHYGDHLVCVGSIQTELSGMSRDLLALFSLGSDADAQGGAENRTLG